jgi:hypothetical protein
MLKGAPITIVSCCVTVRLFESVTFTVNVELPVALGVPEIAPLLSVKPVGREPAGIDQV